MDKRVEEKLEFIEGKVDSALELLVLISEGMIEGEQLATDDVEAWKQRCRARALARRERRGR